MAKRRSKGGSALPWLIGLGAAWVVFGKPSGAAASGTAQSSVAANPLSTMITSIFGPSTPAAAAAAGAPAAAAQQTLSSAGQAYLAQLQSAQAQGSMTNDQMTAFATQLLATATADPSVTSYDLAYLHSASGV